VYEVYIKELRQESAFRMSEQRGMHAARLTGFAVLHMSECMLACIFYFAHLPYFLDDVGAVGEVCLQTLLWRSVGEVCLQTLTIQFFFFLTDF